MLERPDLLNISTHTHAPQIQVMVQLKHLLFLNSYTAANFGLFHHI